MELRENRTELERLLGGVWDYDDVARKKTSLPKWLFALTLTGAVLCTISPSDIAGPVMSALAPAPEKLSIDNVSSENVAEDLDYRIAQHAQSFEGWRAFLGAHPGGPHAQAVRAAIDGLQSAQSSQPDQSEARTQPPVDAAAPSPALSSPAPVEVADPSLASAPATEPQLDPAQSPTQSSPASTAPVVAEAEPPPQPVEAGEQSPPSPAATQAPVAAAQSSAAPPVVAEEEPAPPPESAALLAGAPLPPSRPREVAAAKSVEPAHHDHARAEHRQASQPNVLTVLLAQLFHRHGQRSDIIKTNGRSTSKAPTLLVYGGRPD